MSRNQNRNNNSYQQRVKNNNNYNNKQQYHPSNRKDKDDKDRQQFLSERSRIEHNKITNLVKENFIGSPSFNDILSMKIVGTNLGI